MSNAEILELIRNIRTCDKVSINDWDKPMIVRSVSYHYVLASEENSQKYTIISRDDCTCAPDNSVFGIYIEGFDKQYQFDNPNWVRAYLDYLEDENNPFGMSWRNQVDIVSIKRG